MTEKLERCKMCGGEKRIPVTTLVNVPDAGWADCPQCTRQPAPDVVTELRENGWSVAVHNDYRLNGEPHTFWLWTHPNGRWIKGEGSTDDEALSQCLAALQARPDAALVGELESKITELQAEIEERDEWLQIVDTLPLDEFDKLGDYWVQRHVTVHMVNAIASVFSKFANEDIMTRFRQSMSDNMHLAFVEGCIAGARAERSAALRTHDDTLEEAAKVEDKAWHEALELVRGTNADLCKTAQQAYRIIYQGLLAAVHDRKLRTLNGRVEARCNLKGKAKP